MSSTELRVLVGCETSGVVRRAFAALGHDAWSCDLLPAQDGSNKHYVGDVRDYLHMDWDLLAVMHPPCTRLCNAGVRWLKEPPKQITASHYPKHEREAYKKMSRDERLAFMWRKLEEGAALFSDCWNAPIERIVVENPQMHCYAKERIRNFQEATQHVQPWWFGVPRFKSTGLYTKNLPKLKPTNKLTPPAKGTDEHKQWSAIHLASPGEDRWKIRSDFFPGVARAMAEQYTAHVVGHA